jgi:hypothetical protein
MSNWRVFQESQDLEPKLELSLSQLPDQPLQPPQPPRSRPQDEAGPSERRKRLCFDQFWHGNLQEDSQAMVILLQVGSVEPGGHEVTFQGHFRGPNVDQYGGTTSPSQGGFGQYQYLNGPIYPLSRDQRIAYIATTIQRILEFLSSWRCDQKQSLMLLMELVARRRVDVMDI